MHQTIDSGPDVVFLNFDPAGLGNYMAFPELYSTHVSPEEDINRSLCWLRTHVASTTREALIEKCREDDPNGVWPITYDDESDTFTMYCGSSIAPDLDTWMEFDVV